VRYISLTHFRRSEAAFSSTSLEQERGISPFGLDLIAEMNEKGMMLDLAHISKRCFFEGVLMSRDPVIVSHTAIMHDGGHPRSLDYKQMKAVADKNGVMGIIFCPMFLTQKVFDSAERIIDHIDRVKNKVGIDYVALGSDFDGMINLVDGMRDVRDLPVLTQLMLERDYSEEEIRKVLGLNFLRVYREVCG